MVQETASNAPQDVRTPLVSVVVATYNRADLVGHALRSILDQTYTDFELIVVDDGSTDTTIEILKTFTDERMRVIQHETNKGVGEAYNTGLRAARGSLLAIFDHDDRAEPFWLGRLVNACLSSADVGMAWGWIREHYTDGRPSAIMYRTPFRGESPALLPTMLTWTPGTLGLMFRRDVFDEIGGMDPAAGRAADLDFTIRFATAGRWTVRMVPEVLLHKLAHGSNLSRGVPSKDLAMHKYFLEKHDAILSRYPCTKAHYIYSIGRNAQILGLAEAKDHLAEAVHQCPSNRKYRVYYWAYRANMTRGWKLLGFISSRRARLRGRYRDLRLSMHRTGGHSTRRKIM